MTDRTKTAILTAAADVARRLRDTADRLERAVQRGDFETLSEISIPGPGWTVDQIRGAATVVVREEAGR